MASVKLLHELTRVARKHKQHNSVRFNVVAVAAMCKKKKIRFLFVKVASFYLVLNERASF